MGTVADPAPRAHCPARGSPGPTLGAGPTLRRRLLLHHLPVGVASAVVLVLFTGLSLFTSSSMHNSGDSNPLALTFDPSSRSFGSQLTVATGYLATGLLALTLLIGPLNLMLRRSNPLSNYLRRDLGAWAVAVSAVHVALAFRAGYAGIFSFLDFFVVAGRPLTDSFGLGNWTGLGALLIAAGLLAISTTRAVRELGPRRWKSLQRLNYTVFALALLHAIFYGALRRPASPFAILLTSIVAAVMLGQLVGIWLWRRRRSYRAPRRPADGWRVAPDAQAAR